MITYKKIASIPVFGAAFKIANAYAYKGNDAYVYRFAGLRNWSDRIGKKALVVAVFSVAIVALADALDVKITQSSILEKIFGIIPSLLGFGIGVFALLFVLPSQFIRYIDSKKGKMKFDYRILAPDMAYPLVVMAMILVLGSIVSFMPSSCTGIYLSSFALFYGLAMALELVSMIFTTGYSVMRIKLDDVDTKNDSQSK